MQIGRRGREAFISHMTKLGVSCWGAHLPGGVFSSLTRASSAYCGHLESHLDSGLKLMGNKVPSSPIIPDDRSLDSPEQQSGRDFTEQPSSLDKGLQRILLTRELP